MTDNKAREKEISKAIALIGWLGVQKRLKTKEDKAIFNKLAEKFKARFEAKNNATLKRAGISL